MTSYSTDLELLLARVAIEEQEAAITYLLRLMSGVTFSVAESLGCGIIKDARESVALYKESRNNDD